MAARTRSPCTRWLESCDRCAPGSDRTTGCWRSTHTGNDITQAFARLARRLGLSDFRFHDLRHDCASAVLCSTGDLVAVQRLLGHRDIASTMRYSHLSVQALRGGGGIALGRGNLPIAPT
jgi:site-specific recombinase XerC